MLVYKAKIILLFFTAFSIVFLAYSFIPQDFPSFVEWEKSELDRANTAKNNNSLSEEEKNVVFYTNLARINPKLFAKTILKQVVLANDIERNSALKSLESKLNSVKPMKELQVNDVLLKMAKSYAKSSGIKGQIGHYQFDKRFKPILEQGKLCGENCQYGYENGLDIVIDLLIDDGVQGYGHREVMLNNRFEFIGVAIDFHKEYQHCCVMEFAGE